MCWTARPLLQYAYADPSPPPVSFQTREAKREAKKEAKKAKKSRSPSAPPEAPPPQDAQGAQQQAQAQAQAQQQPQQQGEDVPPPSSLEVLDDVDTGRGAAGSSGISSGVRLQNVSC